MGKRTSRLLSRVLFVHLALLMFTASCQPVLEQNIQTNPTTIFYLPPTPQPIEVELPATVSSILPSAEATLEMENFNSFCSDGLIFIEDLTIPDGTEVLPGETLDKRWGVENSGSCNYDERYRVKLLAGPALEAHEEQMLYPARSGTRFTLRMLFTAPNEAGRFRSAWQAYNPQGEPFGDPFFIEVVVLGSETPTP